ncbi:MAG: alpha/beta hydrolase [Anaerolineae bacterium]
MNSIREYLCAEARRITDAAVRDLPGSAQQWYAQRPERWRQFMEMMGLPQVAPVEERTPLNTKVVDVLERPGYSIEKLYFESLPRLYMTANLYVPKGLVRPAPAVVYVCGHRVDQKHGYQQHARRFAELGFVVIILDTLESVELFGGHQGPSFHGQFQWYSRGYTPAGVEMWNGMRAVDLLTQRPEVDPNAIGVTGISGGGATSWWIGAGDDRVKMVAPVCGTDTMGAHMRNRTFDAHCDCMYFVNTYLWDLADVGALVAPRPLLIASADRDRLFAIESIHQCHEKIREVYSLLGVPDNVGLVEIHGNHHYDRHGRQTIFSWFLKHLMGKDAPPDEIEDVDERPESQESPEALRVFGLGQVPIDERTTSVKDFFVPMTQTPQIRNAEELASKRDELVETLKAKTFRYFAQKPAADLDVVTDIRWHTDTERITKLRFTPEEGWRLDANLVLWKHAGTEPRPTLIQLISSGRRHERVAHQPLLDNVPSGFSAMGEEWARLSVAPRGVNDTSWGDDLAWHVRRSGALIGHTVASMRVLDALRALELARTLPEVDSSHLVLSGMDDMAVVALYAALLDGGVETVVLTNPPASQDEPSPADGTGQATEMLNVLRFTDLPYVAGLLWPTQLVFIEPEDDKLVSTCRPRSYVWTEELYARLGWPGLTRRLRTLSDLRLGQYGAEERDEGLAERRSRRPSGIGSRLGARRMIGAETAASGSRGTGAAT